LYTAAIKLGALSKATALPSVSPSVTSIPLAQNDVFTHAGIAAGVGRTFSRVCLFVRALTGKRLELLTSILVHIYSISVARHALTQRSKGQGHTDTVTKTVTVARLLMTMSRISHTSTLLCYLWPLPAWVCMSIRLLMFYS